MPLGVTCSCTLCGIETRLLSDVSSTEADFGGLFSEFDALRHYSSIPNLLSDLKTAPADLRSDALLAELLAARSLDAVFAQSILIFFDSIWLSGELKLLAQVYS